MTESYLTAPRDAGNWQADAWQKKARRIMDKARANMAKGRGLRYLAERCAVEQATAEAWELGALMDVYNPNAKAKMRAILFPWLTEDRRIMALHYHFVAKNLSKRARFAQMQGGQRNLYGLHMLQGAPGLVLVEGELNAVSIWQAMQAIAPTRFDVLSFGSRTNITNPDVAFMAMNYSRIMTWTNTRDDAIKMRDVLKFANPSARVVAVYNPQVKGDGTLLPVEFTNHPNARMANANDLLQLGRLASTLRATLGKFDAL